MDHATNFIFHHHQTNLTAARTVRPMHYCESLFREYGVRIKEYIADNHPVKASEWNPDIAHQQEAMNYASVGAHHQNVSERHIQPPFSWSRALLLHFVLHWPQQTNENLWPFAVDYMPCFAGIIYQLKELSSAPLKSVPRYFSSIIIIYNELAFLAALCSTFSIRNSKMPNAFSTGLCEGVVGFT